MTSCPNCAGSLADDVSICPNCDATIAMQAQRIAGHRVVRLLGQGGMGRVYLGEDDTLGRRVAVKVMLGGNDQNSESRARFLREARAMANVEHPNIVRIYSFGEEKDGAFIVMEYVDGEMLADRIAGGPLPVDEALRITGQVVDALEAAWEKQIVHRDIKPSNVLIDRRGQVRVADFGLAKPMHLSGNSENSLTQTGYMLGSPHYIAPEQANGQESDFRSDIYSLGIMLYEMLAGEKPFKGTSPFSVVAQHLHDPLPSIAKKRPDVPRDVVALVERMTRKDRDQRPASYAEIRDALVYDKRPRLSPLASDRRWRLSYPALLLSVLIAASAIGVWFWLREPGSKSQPAVAPASKGFSVAVTPFYGPDEDSAKEGRVMAAMIERAILDRLSERKVRVIGIAQTKEPVHSEEAARELARKLDVSVVVWGEAFVIRNETEIQPYFTLDIPPPPPMDATEGIRVSDIGDVRDRRGEQFVLASQAGNQIELRKTNASGVGDIVVTLAGLYALRTGDAAGALDLLSQAPKNGENMRNRVLALVQLEKTDEARAAAAEAVALDPRNARGHILLADLDADKGQWADAASEYAKAVAIDPHISSARAFVDSGKIYAVDWYRSEFVSNGKTIDTNYLLGRDPASGRVLERFYLPGLPRGYVKRDPGVEIRYAVGDKDFSDGTLVFSNSHFDKPLFPPLNLLWRMRGMKAGMVIAANFIKDSSGVKYFAKTEFAPSKEPFEDAPKSFADLDAALRAAMDRDPTQPWHRFRLAQSQISQGHRAEADAIIAPLSDPRQYPGTPYIEFDWMARFAETYGQPRWADELVRVGEIRRKAMPVPITFHYGVEHLINAPFVRWRARMIREGGSSDTARAYEWLERGRAISGLDTEAEVLASATWSRFFRRRGDSAAAEREDAYRSKLKELPINSMIATARLDYAIYAVLAAFIALCCVLLATAMRTRTTRDRLVLAIASLAMVVSAGTLFVAIRMLVIHSLPIGTSDSLGHSAMVQRLEHRLANHAGNQDLIWVTAVANHYAGNRERAKALYDELPDDARARENREALAANRFVPPHYPQPREFLRAFNPSSWKELNEKQALGLDAFRKDPPLRLAAIGGAFVLTAILAALLLIAFPRITMPNRAGKRIAWIVPGFGDILEGETLRGWLLAAAFGLSATTLLIRVKVGTSFAQGLIGNEDLPNVFNSIPMPNPQGLTGEAYSKSHFWTIFWAYPGAVTFTAIALIAIAYTITTHAMWIRARRTVHASDERTQVTAEPATP